MHLSVYNTCMNRIAVVGCNGFVGSHLVEALKKRGCVVIGIGRQAKLINSLSAFVDEYYSCDVLDKDAIKNLPLQSLDAIANLAGLTSVKDSFDNPDAYLDVNVRIHTVLLERIKKLDKNIRILATSSGIVYDSTQPMPVSEDGVRISEGSPYARSKVLMEDALSVYIKSGMDIVIARPFNHTGPGQGPGFLLPDLANQLVRGDIMKVSPLNTSRDYTDVRDVVSAYCDLLEAGKLEHNTYNICSGVPTSRDDLIEAILEVLHKEAPEFVIDESLVRPNDPVTFYGDSARIREELGWQPSISLKQTIKDYFVARGMN